MGEADVFGDLRLAPRELVPRSASERVLSWCELVWVWAAVGALPAAYGFGAGSLPVGAAALAWGLGVGLGVFTALAVARGAAYYGLGAVPLLRAALGPRGAVPALVLRLTVTLVWAGAFVATSGHWAAELAVAAGRAGAGGSVGAIVGATATATAIAGVGAAAGGSVGANGPAAGQELGLLASAPASALGLGAAALLVLVGWLATSARLSRAVRLLAYTVPAWLICSVAFVVLAGHGSRGFGSHLTRALDYDAGALVEATLRAWTLALPAMLAAADWLSAARHAPTRALQWADRLTAGAALLSGLWLGLCGALAASASMTLLGSVAAHPIADGAAFAGRVGGAVGLAVTLGTWLCFAPLVVYSGLAHVWLGLGIWPRTHRGALGVVALALFAASAVSIIWPASPKAVLAAAPAVLAGLVGASLASQALRRGRVQLEELFLYAGDYGPTAGVSVAGVVSVAVGLLAHPLVRTAAAAAAGPRAVAVARAVPLGAGCVTAVVVSFVVYLALRPLEGALWRRWRARGATVAKAQTADAPGQNVSRGVAPRDLSREVTDPNYVPNAERTGHKSPPSF